MTKEKPVVAAIYARVSSPKQVKAGNGLQSQVSTCNAHCKENGFEVVEIFQDDSSGGNDDREGLHELKRWLTRNKAHKVVVVFDALSRVSRDVKIYHEIKEFVLAAGAKFSCPTFRFDETPEGELAENIQVSFDQYHRKSNAAQTKRRQHARIADGYWCFAAPFGYRSGGKGKVMEQHETFGPIAKAALEGYACGHFQSHAEVRTYIERQPEFRANRRGRLGNSVVKNMLTNVIYTGHLEYKPWGIDFRDAKHEALISMRTFDEIQLRLNEKNRAPQRKDLAKDFPLRGFVTCADCGSPLTAAFSKNRTGKRYPYYACHKKGCVSYRKSIPKEKIEMEFLDRLASIEPSTNVVDASCAILRDMWNSREKHAVIRRKKLQTEAKKLEVEIDGFLDRIVESSNPSIVEAYEKRVAALQYKKAATTEKLAEFGQKQLSFDKMFEHSIKILSNPCNIWKNRDIKWKRMVLKVVFAERLAYCRKSGFQTAKTTFPFKALADLEGELGKMVPPHGLEPRTY
ncbi:recombinase family protein [Yoonia maritima]|uniref:recombinase family protein n=1 Tax=Yoonia maritima TaxID=1435347 RepID=UPI003D28E4A6